MLWALIWLHLLASNGWKSIGHDEETEKIEYFVQIFFEKSIYTLNLLEELNYLIDPQSYSMNSVRVSLGIR